MSDETQERRRSVDTDVLALLNKQTDLQARMLDQVVGTLNSVGATQAVHANILKNMSDWQLAHEREQKQTEKEHADLIGQGHARSEQLNVALVTFSASMATLWKVVAVVPTVVGVISLIIALSKH